MENKDIITEEYDINPLTMIIFPHPYGSKLFSQVIEFEDEYVVPRKPLDLIKRGCEYNLADYDARKKASRKLAGITHKSPVVVDPLNHIYFLPTISPVKAGCIWVSHEHVLDHRRHDARSTRVLFRNKQTFILPVSYASFEHQLLKTSLLRTRTMQRLHENEKKASYLLRSQRGRPGIDIVGEGPMFNLDE